jgi:hypothetical protein
MSNDGLSKQQMQDVVSLLRDSFEAHLEAEHSPQHGPVEFEYEPDNDDEHSPGSIRERQAANKPTVSQVTHVCPDASCDGQKCIRADERKRVCKMLSFKRDYYNTASEVYEVLSDTIAELREEEL